MRIVHLPVLVETLVPYCVFPLLLPFLVIPFEICLASLVESTDQVLQFPAGQHPGALSQIPPDNLLHMELTHLYAVL